MVCDRKSLHLVGFTTKTWFSLWRLDTSVAVYRLTHTSNTPLEVVAAGGAGVVVDVGDAGAVVDVVDVVDVAAVVDVLDVAAVVAVVDVETEVNRANEAVFDIFIVSLVGQTEGCGPLSRTRAFG